MFWNATFSAERRAKKPHYAPRQPQITPQDGSKTAQDPSMLRPRPAQDRPRIPQDPPGPSASTVFLPLALARTMFLRSSDDGEHDFLALRHWRGRFSCPLQALASIIFSPFGACEDVSPAFWRCRARCFCPLALASTMFLPFGTGEDDAPAIWR